MSVLKRRTKGTMYGQYVIMYNPNDASYDISKNRGLTWTRTRQADLPDVNSDFFTNVKNRIAMSDDGRHIYVACYTARVGVFHSTDFLKTIEKLDLNTYTVFTPSIACSGDGKFVGATYSNASQVYSLTLSSDYGQTWKMSSLRNQGVLFADVKMSHSGQYIVVIASGSGYSTHCLHMSSDYGVTFNSVAFGGLIQGVAISGNGKYILCCGSKDYASDSGYVYCSGDQGQTWTKISNSTYYQSYGMNISYDGKYMIVDAGPSYSGVYISTDYGKTWTFKALDAFRYSIGAMSWDGKHTLIKSLGFPYDMYRSSDYLNSFTKVENGTEQIASYSMIMSKNMP